VALAWLVEIADQVFGFIGLPLDALGIRPRQFLGLVGVFLSPWLHGDWLHLTNNSIAFLGLGFLMVLAEGRRFLATTFLLVIMSGLGTWLIGRSGTIHVGASGLIYGYFGYLLLRAWTERRPLWIVVGIGVAIVYGSMLWGVLPTTEGISWEAHLCGLLGGLWLGRSHGLGSQTQSKLFP
jgi:membrane associated rhomboid family serine protease